MMESGVHSGIVALVAFLLAAAGNILAEQRQSTIGRYLTKPLLMPLLAIFYAQSAIKPAGLILAALFCAFLGDVFLLWSEKQLLFTAGLFSFLLGHVFYIIVFGQSVRSLSGVPVWFCISLIPYGVYGFLIYRIISPNLQALKVPTVLYMIVIIVMSFSSLLRVWVFNGYSFWLPFLGSLLFLTSDSLLAIQNFKAKIRNGEVLVMGTYVWGQLSIILGLLR